MGIREKIENFHNGIRELTDTDLERKLEAIYDSEKRGVIESEELRKDIEDYANIIESPFHTAMIAYPQIIYREASKRYLDFINGRK